MPKPTTNLCPRCSRQVPAGYGLLALLAALGLGLQVDAEAAGLEIRMDEVGATATVALYGDGLCRQEVELSAANARIDLEALSAACPSIENSRQIEQVRAATVFDGLFFTMDDGCSA